MVIGGMKRITVTLSDDLAAALGREARRRGESVSAVARLAIRTCLGESDRRLPFVALGRSGHRHTARDAESVLEQEGAREPRR
ncbi:MAG: ribbon-helix-helix protein, CopG family [Candidatus Latescibacteria bacterium]|nr:ribbon-helix-helix protein, CopG family [Candidatus Latescibacterota bacterium]